MENQLLINPILAVGLPVENFTVAEPQSNFTLGILNRITSVADVSPNLNAKVSSDSSRGRFQRIRCAKHLSAGRNRLLTLQMKQTDDKR